MGRLASKLAHLGRTRRVNRNEAADRPIPATEILKELTRNRRKNEEHIFSLRCKQISGNLDLRHQRVEVAVDIQGCDFLGEVDLRHCEFAQDVNLSRCTFHQDFSSGGHHAANTVYLKDLICNKAVFGGAVGFYGSRIEGSAHFWNAVFRNEEEPVDFRMARIGKTLECEETVFRGPVNLNGLKCDDAGVFYRARFLSEHGGEFGYATFGGNLECDEIMFKGPAYFNGVTVNAYAFFKDATFESKKETSFSGAVIGRDLNCDRATFKGRANFNALQCNGAGLFRGARFEGAGETNFDHAYFGHVFDCSSCEHQETNVVGPANFRYLKCSLIHAVGTVFKGEVSFNTLQCTGTGFFDDAKFEGEGSVNFGHASFGMNLVCRRVEFQGPAEFDSLSCGLSGMFHECTFQKDADFDHAHFGTNMSCDSVTFCGPATFRSLECADSGLFRNAQFEDDAKFGGAVFGGNLECNGKQTVFKKSANFNRVRCERSGRFDEVCFLSTDKTTDLVHTHFGVNLNLEGAHFAGPVDLWMAHVGQTLRLTGARFERTTALRGATIGQIEIRDSVLPFTRGNLRMRGCTFASFIGDESVATQVVEAQDIAAFSRDPYLQLERYYSNIGDDIQATQIYRKGRLAHLKNAWVANTSTHWSKKTIVKDWFLKVSTYYGTQTWRLLVPLVLLFVLGTWLFWPDDSLRPIPSASAEPPAKIVTSSTSADKNENADNLEPKAVYRPGYSLDLLLPVVNLHFENQWEPRNPWLRAYAAFQIVMGWILIPLLLASLAGFIRRT